jgi:integrase/recombinase XerD
MINQFLATLESQNTQRSYSTALNEFFDNNQPYSSISILDAISYSQALKTRGLKNSSINLRLSALSSFYDYIAFVTEQNIPNPFSNSHLRKKSSTSEIEILSPKEVTKLLSVIKNPYHHALFNLLFHTGLRRSEIVLLTQDNFIKINKDWFVRIFPEQSKSNKYRDIFIPTEIKSQIDSISKPGQYIFPMTEQNVYKQLLKYSKLANIKKHITPHIIRHTVATQALQNGADVTEVQQMLGHASIETTMRYVHFLETHKNSASRKLKYSNH